MRPTRRKTNLWSANDLKLLRKLAGRESVTRIAGRLRRSVLAVRFKAHMTGISLAHKRTR